MTGPGATINAENLQSFIHVVPLALASIVRLGHNISVTPTETIAWPPAYKTETEKYSPQVHLEPGGIIENYVTGLPFPLIDYNDPNVAVKIAYNWRYGPFVPDDFLARNLVSRFYRQRGHRSELWHDPDWDVTSREVRYLRFAHRTTVDPVPSLPSNPASVESEERADGIHDPIYINDEANIVIRFLDPARPDEYYRLDRRGGRVQRYDQKYQGEFFGWRTGNILEIPKTSRYDFHLIGTATILGCIAAKVDPVREASGPFEFVAKEPFQLRRVYVLQRQPKDPKWRRYLTIDYIDTESYLDLATEYYKGSRMTGAVVNLWVRQSPGGPYYSAVALEYLPSGVRYLSGGFGSPGPPSGSGSSYYVVMPPTAGSLDTGNISTSIFDPGSLRWSSPE